MVAKLKAIKVELRSHCTHIDARGHRCRMLLAADHNSFCPHHVRQSLNNPPDPESLAAELLSEVEDVSDAPSVNHFLGNVLKQLARNRIQPRDAIAMSYISQLLPKQHRRPRQGRAGRLRNRTSAHHH
jgi:hypothetical protein